MEEEEMGADIGNELVSLIAEYLISSGFITGRLGDVNRFGSVVIVSPYGSAGTQNEDYPIHRVTVHPSKPAPVHADEGGGCHGSCSKCRGLTQQECLSCSDPAASLKDGVCVFDCGAGYYNQEGICYACDLSCASCFPDNPKCMSCPTGTALHHGKCITQCPTQHYVDNHSRCRACHSSCATCWGPSVSHCISCPSGLLLHQGQCVEACGEGLYPQDSTCHNCHPSCRSCVGPLASDCLRCLKPEEVLLPQHIHLRHGICTSGCPEHSFLDNLQTCR
ncbi:hypothetical protein ILYODFUR_011079, partial [Ilyodon furcidens]